MANTTNVPITPGSGTNIETENVSQPGGTTGDRQRMQIGGRAGTTTTEAANDVAGVLNSDPADTEFGLTVRAAGRIKPSYANGAILTTVVTLNDTTPVALPTTPLTGRRKFQLINQDAAATVYWGGTGVTNTGAAQGVPLGPYNSTPIMDFGPGVAVFAVSSAGTTPSVVILEVAE